MLVSIEEEIAFTPRDRFLLIASLGAFVLWISTVGPVRWLAEGNDLRSFWMLGVAPSFFAGVTFTWWQACFTGTGPFASAGYALALIALAEVAQLAMPHQTADVWDVVAGAAGVAVAAPVVRWRARRAVQ